MKFILAGNRKEAEKYIQHEHLGRKDAHIVSSANSLRGITIFPGDVICCGTYYKRRDLPEIEDNIRCVTHDPR